MNALLFKTDREINTASVKTNTKKQFNESKLSTNNQTITIDHQIQTKGFKNYDDEDLSESLDSTITFEYQELCSVDFENLEKDMHNFYETQDIHMVKVTDGESIFDRTPKNTFKSWHVVLDEEELVKPFDITQSPNKDPQFRKSPQVPISLQNSQKALLSPSPTLQFKFGSNEQYSPNSHESGEFLALQIPKRARTLNSNKELQVELETLKITKKAWMPETITPNTIRTECNNNKRKFTFDDYMSKEETLNRKSTPKVLQIKRKRSMVLNGFGQKSNLMARRKKSFKLKRSCTMLNMSSLLKNRRSTDNKMNISTGFLGQNQTQQNSLKIDCNKSHKLMLQKNQTAPQNKEITPGFCQQIDQLQTTPFEIKTPGFLINSKLQEEVQINIIKQTSLEDNNPNDLLNYTVSDSDDLLEAVTHEMKKKFSFNN